MADDKNLEICYNRGCGKKFDPNNNNKEGMYNIYFVMFAISYI